jgi:hypothetical protein
MSNKIDEMISAKKQFDFNAIMVQYNKRMDTKKELNVDEEEEEV